MKYLEFGKPFFCVLGYLLAHFLLRMLFQLADLSPEEAGALGSIILAAVLAVCYYFFNKKQGCAEKKTDSICGMSPAVEREPVSFPAYAGSVIQGICLGIAMHGLGAEGNFAVSPLLIAGFGIAGPIAEEIIYRGYVLKKGESLFGTRKAVCLSVLLFAVAHETPSAIFFAGVAGFLFSVSYLRTGRLLSPILFHITVNLCSFFPADCRFSDILL